MTREGFRSVTSRAIFKEANPLDNRASCFNDKSVLMVAATEATDHRPKFSMMVDALPIKAGVQTSRAVTASTRNLDLAPA